MSWFYGLELGVEGLWVGVGSRGNLWGQELDEQRGPEEDPPSFIIIIINFPFITLTCNV